MKKQMRLSVSVRFTLVDRPAGFHGLCSESISIGQHEPVSLSDMLRILISKTLVWYRPCTDDDTVVQEVREVISILTSILEEKKE